MIEKTKKITQKEWKYKNDIKQIMQVSDRVDTVLNKEERLKDIFSYF